MPGMAQLVTVEYPGRVENPDRAVATLGGLAALAASSHPSADTPLLCVPPGSTRPLQGTRRSSPGFLLRFSFAPPASTPPQPPAPLPDPSIAMAVDPSTDKSMEVDPSGSTARPASSNPDAAPPDTVAAGGWRHAVLGKVAATHSFGGMADFQCAVDPAVPWCADVEAPDFFDKETSIRTVPPTFSRDDTPFGYNFQQSTTVPKGSLDSAGGAASGSGRILVPLFSIDDDAGTVVPSAPNPALPTVRKPRQLRLLATLTQLFQKRPVWARDPLEQQLGEECRKGGHDPYSWSHVNETLPHLAYKFSNGPFRTTFARFGFDPRKEPQSYVFQVHSLPRDPSPGALHWEWVESEMLCHVYDGVCVCGRVCVCVCRPTTKTDAS
eukprot:m.261882 g.261882  ORF g.261882 m.261882 type:complete len:381 (+) comp15999_c1_seq5:2360-3502(+)